MVYIMILLGIDPITTQPQLVSTRIKYRRFDLLIATVATVGLKSPAIRNKAGEGATYEREEATTIFI